VKCSPWVALLLPWLQCFRRPLGSHCRHLSAVRDVGAGHEHRVGYAGLLDLGYVAFYPSALPVALLTRHAPQLCLVRGDVPAGQQRPGAHPPAGALWPFFSVLLGAPTLKLRHYLRSDLGREITPS